MRIITQTKTTKSNSCTRTTRKTPLSSLDCTVGCDSNLKSINQLESEHLHINDGFIGNKYWKAGMQGLNTCKPMTAWDGQIDGLERKLHLIQENERVCAKLL